MKTKKPTSKTVDKWTRSPEEIFREHGLTLKWGNKTGSRIFPAQSIRLKDNNS
jgi:Leucine-rich repeat (LRR) protein